MYHTVLHRGEERLQASTIVRCWFDILDIPALVKAAGVLECVLSTVSAVPVN